MSAGRPTSLAELTRSDEADLEIVIPWMGPAIRADGSLDPDVLPETFCVATSAGWPKDDVAEEATALNAEILADLMQLDGMLATCVAVSPGNWNVARNLMVWRDATALKHFLNTPAHLKAAKRTRALMYDWESTSWVSTRKAGLPDFAEARARLTAVRQETSPYASFD